MEKLEKSDLQELFSGNILALRYPGFCSEWAASEITKAIMGHKLLDEYKDNRGIGRLGQGCIELLLGTSWEAYVSTKDEVIEAFQVNKDISQVEAYRVKSDRA